MANGSPKQFSDVLRPGETAANATSKPIIVGNRPVTKDPMFLNDIKHTSDKIKVTSLDEGQHQHKPSTNVLSDTVGRDTSKIQAKEHTNNSSSEIPLNDLTSKVMGLPQQSFSLPTRSFEVPANSKNTINSSKPQSTRGRKILIVLAILFIAGVVSVFAYKLAGAFIK